MKAYLYNKLLKNKPAKTTDSTSTEIAFRDAKDSKIVTMHQTCQSKNKHIAKLNMMQPTTP